MEREEHGEDEKIEDNQQFETQQHDNDERGDG